MDIEDRGDTLASRQIPWEEKNPRLESVQDDPRRHRRTLSKQALACTEPIDYFHLIFDESMFDEMVRATNKYYYSHNAKAAEGCPRQHRPLWKDVNKIDMKKFVGLLYWMGIVKKPDVREHWATDPLLDTPIVRKVLTRERYLDIRRNFRMLDEEKAAYDDPLRKIRNFINKVIENSRKHYTPTKSLSLDESMIAFKGRHKFKVYMLRKPTKHGFKAYVLAESSTGFALAWEMHHFSDDNPFSLRKTLGKLLAPFKDGGYTVYMDRYYTSPGLLTELAKHNIKACGTVLSGRLKLSESVQEEIKAIQPLGYKHFNYEGLTLGVWRDGTRHVYMLSSFHDAAIVNGIRRIRKKEKHLSREMKFQNIILPKMVVDYNILMGGVDRLDQRMSYDSNTHGHNKWQNRVFYYFLDLIIVNSYLIYKTKRAQEGKQYMQTKAFKMEVIRKLFGIPGIDKVYKIPKKQYDIVQKISDCYLISIPEGQESPNCKYCSNQVRQVKTEYMCQTCRTSVCAIGCYDVHRKARARVSVLKKNDKKPEEIKLLERKKPGKPAKKKEVAHDEDGVSDEEGNDEKKIVKIKKKSVLKLRKTSKMPMRKRRKKEEEGLDGFFE